MSDTNVFTIRKSSDIKRQFAVSFLRKEVGSADYDVVEAYAEAYDSDGNDVSNDILDNNYLSYEDNKVYFIVQNGVSGQTYQLRIGAKMSNVTDETEWAWGLLVVIDPVLS